MRRKNRCQKCGKKRLRSKLYAFPITKSELVGVDENGTPVFRDYDSVFLKCHQCPPKKDGK